MVTGTYDGILQEFQERIRTRAKIGKEGSLLPSTQIAYSSDVAQFLEILSDRDVPLSPDAIDEIERAIKHYLDPSEKAPATIRRQIVSLGELLSGHGIEVPFREILPSEAFDYSKQEIRIPTDKDITQLFEAIREKPRSRQPSFTLARDILSTFLMAYGGLGPLEICELNPDDFETQQNVAEVREIRRKSLISLPVTIKYSPEDFPEVANYQDILKRTFDFPTPLIPSARGEKMDSRSLRGILEDTSKKLKFGYISAKHLRNHHRAKSN